MGEGGLKFPFLLGFEPDTWFVGVDSAPNYLVVCGRFFGKTCAPSSARAVG